MTRHDQIRSGIRSRVRGIGYIVIFDVWQVLKAKFHEALVAPVLLLSSVFSAEKGRGECCAPKRLIIEVVGLVFGVVGWCEGAG